MKGRSIEYFYIEYYFLLNIWCFYYIFDSLIIVFLFYSKKKEIFLNYLSPKLGWNQNKWKFIWWYIIGFCYNFNIYKPLKLKNSKYLTGRRTTSSSSSSTYNMCACNVAYNFFRVSSSNTSFIMLIDQMSSYRKW